MKVVNGEYSEKRHRRETENGVIALKRKFGCFCLFV